MTRSRADGGRPDTRVTVGTVELRHPLLLASGTAGYGDELAPYVDLGAVGGVITKSLAAFAWDGNRPPRVHGTKAGMLNAIGLQGPGVAAWLVHDLPRLIATGGTVVASIWGRTVEEYREAAELMAAAPPEVVAVEVNLSCPNLKGHGMFASAPDSAAAAIEATAGCGRPRWAKLTAAAADLVGVAKAVHLAGADAVTLINTVPGMAIDLATRRAVLSNGSGGLSGPAIHPIAVKAVFDVRAALPDLPIVAAGGVVGGDDLIEFVMAGADAVQVGTASFADPAAANRIAAEADRWCRANGVSVLRNLRGVAHT